MGGDYAINPIVKTRCEELEQIDGQKHVLRQNVPSNHELQLIYSRKIKGTLNGLD